ncbi:MAG: hypothetical protein R3C68_11475 [Myxococcota bacterium]
MATILAHVIPKTGATNLRFISTSFAREVLEPAARQGIAQFCDVFVEAGA